MKFREFIREGKDSGGTDDIFKTILGTKEILAIVWTHLQLETTTLLMSQKRQKYSVPIYITQKQDDAPVS